MHLMGVAAWIGAAACAFLVARNVPLGRPRSRMREILIALAAALVGGMTATALDFGGWSEPDLAPALFVGLLSFGAIAVGRMVTRESSRRPQSTRRIV
jgi:hypothetical protein